MPVSADQTYMRQALRLAERAYGETSPNPLVGALLVKQGRMIGRGWHHQAGQPHAEIEAINDAQRNGHKLTGATLYVTLEPCCTYGRTPPCTEAIIRAGIRRVVVAATDPNPKHAGHGFELLRSAGIVVEHDIHAALSERLNESFNHWIVGRTPFVTVKAAMTLDGKIATATGESKWITNETSRLRAMHLRQGVDAILVGINTVLFDDPSLTIRAKGNSMRCKRRIVIDPRAQIPLTAKLLTDEFAHLTTVVTTDKAPARKLAAIRKKVNVVQAALSEGRINLKALLKQFGSENVTSILVEGGGETNARFFDDKLVDRVAFFYAPKILCGRDSRKGVAGLGLVKPSDQVQLRDVEWEQLDGDLFLTARTVAG